MAKYAYTTPYGINGYLCDAADLQIHDRRNFYCSTPGCTARMFVRSPQRKSATFVTYRHEHHTGGPYCQLKDQFQSDKYDESKFNLQRFFDNINNDDIDKDDRVSRFETGGVGKNQLIPIKTLTTLYHACLQYRERGTYNNYDINDILIDSRSPDNAFPFKGNRMIVCHFDYYFKQNNTVRMKLFHLNQTYYFNLHCVNSVLYQQLRDKTYDVTHNNLFVVAATWNRNQNNNTYDCDFHSLSKQICRGDR